MAARAPQLFGLPWWVPVGGVFLLIAWPQLVGKIAHATGGAAVRIVHDAATGAVIAIGEAVGVPATDAALCEQHVAAGDWWQASFYCPAGTFLKSASGAVIDTATGVIVGVATYSPVAEIIRLSPWTGDEEPITPGPIEIPELPGTAPFPDAPNIADYPAA